MSNPSLSEKAELSVSYWRRRISTKLIKEDDGKGD
jgi:hypothetical protein